jgi:hypothetical protein
MISSIKRIKFCVGCGIGRFSFLMEEKITSLEVAVLFVISSFSFVV